MHEAPNEVGRYRAAKRWSKKELADRAGLDPTTVGRIERGEITPSIDTAWALADAFEMTLDAVFPRRVKEAV